jgi:TatD DNase family protein
MMLVDTHIHLDDPGYDKDRDTIICRAKEKGVDHIITVGSDLTSSSSSIALTQGYDILSAAVGVHPHEAKRAGADTYTKLKALAQNKRVVAIGEIGLDYYYDHSPRTLQREVFHKQMSLAKELELPVIIHTREALSDTIEMVKEEGISKGVFHCFSGSLAEAEEVISLGFYVSVAGPVTFKNAQSIKDVAREVPLARLLLETDGPYLTPHPFRGKRNEPGYLRYIAEEIAELRDLAFEEIAYVTTENAKILFGLV